AVVAARRAEVYARGEPKKVFDLASLVVGIRMSEYAVLARSQQLTNDDRERIVAQITDEMSRVARTQDELPIALQVKAHVLYWKFALLRKDAGEQAFHLGRALELDDADPELNVIIARNELTAGRSKAALEALDRSIDAGRANIVILNEAVGILKQRGELGRARELWQMGMTMPAKSPDDAQALEALSHQFRQGGS
ncbi:MAG: hypothetical protein KDB53_18055, partial [Planctomycetes bacterium]|nr:hypothetical protein [Planctomycetota bacterium]